MPRKIGTIKAVADNFIGTIASRYSDFRGYWLLGFLVENELPLDIDLLGSDLAAAVSPAEYARSLSREKFSEQMRLNLFPLAKLVSAKLRIERASVYSVEGLVNSRPSSGFMIRFSVETELTNGRVCRVAKSVFVAPHNPAVEQRSGRAG